MTTRIDAQGRDVTDLPGLWDETDRIILDVKVVRELSDTIENLLRAARNTKERYVAAWRLEQCKVLEDAYLTLLDARRICGPL